jgi:hypothetical protein
VTRMQAQMTLCKHWRLRLLVPCFDVLLVSVCRFAFHHANLDRHFQTWALQQMYLPNGTQRTIQELNYLGFPATGFGNGCNLEDIVSSTNPFVGLLMPYADNAGNRFRPSPTKPITIEVCQSSRYCGFSHNRFDRKQLSTLSPIFRTSTSMTLRHGLHLVG